MTDQEKQHQVLCKKLGKELPGLKKPPLPGALGTEVFENISSQAWQLWLEEQTKLINEQQLKVFEKTSQDILKKHLIDFLGLKPSLP